MKIIAPLGFKDKPRWADFQNLIKKKRIIPEAIWRSNQRYLKVGLVTAWQITAPNLGSLLHILVIKELIFNHCKKKKYFFVHIIEGIFYTTGHISNSYHHHADYLLNELKTIFQVKTIRNGKNWISKRSPEIFKA